MNKILEYQKLDAEKIRIEKSLNNIEERQVMNKMIAFVKDAQNKSLQIEQSSKKLIEDYENLRKSYETNTSNIEKLTKTNVSSMTKEELDACLKKVNALSSELFMIERNIGILIQKINEKLKEFEATKNSAGKARAKHKEAKAKYDAKVEEIEPKISEIDKKLSAMEKEIPAEIMAKYKGLKNDGIFPILVPLQDKTCGGCRMEIPSKTLDKLKNTDVIQCEHCRRIVYK